ncbi:hypothetical protein [Leclercia sp.]|uniref:hypothetical protein n=1 Tax=Leclercia sp. TaxID=1898428 RepID=UPI0028B204D5|nr:hypothetical protein [Leclercia sp.]
MFGRDIGNLLSKIFAEEIRNGQQISLKKNAPTHTKLAEPFIDRRGSNVSNTASSLHELAAASEAEASVPVSTLADVDYTEANLPAELTIYVPFRKYTFTLHHQILSRLGNVSQFVFRALATDGCDIDDVARITGLSPAHLVPILERLAGFGWYELKSNTLTASGRMMAQAVALNGQRFSLWIDSHCNRSQAQILLSEDRLCEADMITTGTTLGEFERDWNILAVLQQQRLSRRLGSRGKEEQGELLPLLKKLSGSAFHVVLCDQYRAWDFQLEVDRESSKSRYLAITLPQGFYPGDGKGRKKLYAPVLNYGITHTLPAWLADELPLPKPVNFTFCLLTGHKINEAEYEEQASSWPEEMMLSRPAMLEKIRTMVPPADPLISQKVSLTLATRKMALSYEVVARELIKSMPSLSGDEE